MSLIWTKNGVHRRVPYTVDFLWTLSVKEVGMDRHTRIGIAVYTVAMITFWSPPVARAQQKGMLDLASECREMNPARTVREVGQGDIMKDYCAGLFYKLGAEGVPKNTTTAMRCYRRTAGRGFPAGQMAVGSLYADQGDYTQAKEWYLKAASQNYGDAQ